MAFTLTANIGDHKEDVTVAAGGATATNVSLIVDDTDTQFGRSVCADEKGALCELLDVLKRRIQDEDWPPA